MLTPGIKDTRRCVSPPKTPRWLWAAVSCPCWPHPPWRPLIERACWQSVAAELELDQGTVGTALTLAHTAPTPAGGGFFPFTSS